MIEYQHLLTYNSVTTEVEEPRGLQDIPSVLDRDFATHGVLFRFTDADLRLSFPGIGQQILSEALDNEGVDATVTYTLNKRQDEFSPWILQFSGQAIFENYSDGQDFFEIDFEEVNLITLVQSNLDVKVDLDRTTDLFGNAVTPLSATQITFPPVPLISSGSLDKTSSSNWLEYNSGTLLFPINTFLQTKNTLVYEDGTRGFIGSKLSQSATIQVPANRLSAVPFKDERSFKVNVSFSGQFDFVEQVATVDGTVRIDLVELDVVATTESIIDSFIWNVPVDGSLFDEQLNLGQTYVITDTEYQWFVRITSTLGNTGLGFVRVDNSNLQIDTETYNDFSGATTANFYRFFDSIDKTLEYITGEENLLKSDFLDNAGCAEDIYESNGNKIRSREDIPVQGTLVDRLNTCRSVFGLGWGFEQDYNGVLNVFRIEPIEYFYQDVELESFTDIENDSYQEEYFDGLDFGNIEIGYEKYAEDEELTVISTINDTNTEAQYVSPVQRLKGNLSLKSDHIASPFLIEVTRRIQFDPNENEKSWKYDDDLFLLEVSGGAPADDTNISTFNVETDIPYNLRLNPRFNLFNSSRLINSGFFRKPLSAEIVPSFYAINQTARIYYTSPLGECLGDLSGDNVAMKENIQVGNFNAGLRLFDPKLISFRVGMKAEQVENLVAAHRNGLPSKNYGYISVTNPDGEIRQGWVLNVAWNIIDEIATFQLIKKADNYF